MNKLDIICIIDMSGSMSSIINKAREGFNKFLKEQKKSGNKIKLWLMFFDDNFYVPYEGIDIKKVKKLTEDTYYANGSTALLDATGTMISNYIDYLGSKSKDKRSDKALFVILTDGYENASRVYHKNLIKLMITEMQEEFNSSFIYLGANQNACFEAESLGIDKTNAFNYDATNDGITVAYSKINSAVNYYVTTEEKDNLFQQ